MLTSVRWVLIAFGTAVYLGLAVFAFGGVAAFFSQPALIALAAVLVVISVAAVFAGGTLSSGEREDRGNRWVIWAIGILGLLDVYLPPWADRRDIWTFDGETIRWVGVVLFAVGGALRLWPVVVLGNRFSGLVAIQKGHELVGVPLWDRRGANGVPGGADRRRTHSGGGASVGVAVRGALPGLPSADVKAHSRRLLASCGLDGCLGMTMPCEIYALTLPC